MTLYELIAKADAGYRKGFDGSAGSCPFSDLLSLIDPDTGEPNVEDAGDTLALFVVRELASSYDKNGSDDLQTEQAASDIRQAIVDLENVLSALEE